MEVLLTFHRNGTVATGKEEAAGVFAAGVRGATLQQQLCAAARSYARYRKGNLPMIRRVQAVSPLSGAVEPKRVYLIAVKAEVPLYEVMLCREYIDNGRLKQAIREPTTFGAIKVGDRFWYRDHWFIKSAQPHLAFKVRPNAPFGAAVPRATERFDASMRVDVLVVKDRGAARVSAK